MLSLCETQIPCHKLSYFSQLVKGHRISQIMSTKHSLFPREKALFLEGVLCKRCDIYIFPSVLSVPPSLSFSLPFSFLFLFLFNVNRPLCKMNSSVDHLGPSVLNKAALLVKPNFLN